MFKESTEKDILDRPVPGDYKNNVTKLPLAVPQARLELIDLLRGIALLGVLLTHMHSPFSGLDLMTAEQKAAVNGPLDSAAEMFTRFFFYNKARGIFSICFGVSFYFQLLQASKYLADFRKQYLLRLFVLFIFGVLHSALFFPHEILRQYAILGVVLLFVYHLKPALLLTGAVLFAFVVPVFLTFFPDLPQPYSINLPNLISAFGHFLAGFWAARKNIFANGVVSAKTLNRLIRWSLAFSILLNGGRVVVNMASQKGLIKPEYIPETLTKISEIAGAQVMIVFYIGIIMFIHRKKFLSKWEHLFTYTGRMTLTNYIMQSVMAAVIFSSFGFDMKFKIGAFTASVIGCGLFLLQVLYSKWWLKRFKTGPLEWLWRSAYKFSWQPLRKLTVDR